MEQLLSLIYVPQYILVFARIAAFFVTVPLFSYRTIPTTFKIGLSIFLAIILAQTVPLEIIPFDMFFIVLLLKEVMVGIFIGLIAFMVVSAVQIAGGFIDFQMGFAIANVVDPQTGAQSPLIGQYFYIIALLFLLAVNGHHMLIDGLHYSFQVIALDSFIPFSHASIGAFIVQTFNAMFVIAFQIAIPIVGCLFLVDVALGLIARTVPQLNVFVVGLPIKIFVSFVAILIFLGMYMYLAEMLFKTMFDVMKGLTELFGGA